jgi:hypothetical protein
MSSRSIRLSGSPQKESVGRSAVRTNSDRGLALSITSNTTADSDETITISDIQNDKMSDNETELTFRQGPKGQTIGGTDTGARWCRRSNCRRRRIVSFLFVIEELTDGAFADSREGRGKGRIQIGIEAASSRNAGRSHDLASQVRTISSFMCLFSAATERERQPVSTGRRRRERRVVPALGTR